MSLLIKAVLMNRVLGSLLVSIMALDAAFECSIKTQTHEVYAYEPFLLSVACAFDDNAPNTFVEIMPKQAGVVYDRQNFTDRVNEDNRRTVVSSYLVHITDAKIKGLNIKGLIRKSTEESVRQTILGRDNDKELDFDDTPVHLTHVLKVHSVPKEAQAVGSFRMTRTVSSQAVSAFEPVRVHISIQGKGNFNHIKAPFDTNMSGVKVFDTQEQRAINKTVHSYEGSINYQYALVSDNNFTIKPSIFSYFDIYSKRVKTITLDEVPIKVKKIPTKTLIEEVPQQQSYVFDYKKWGMYLLIFILGALSYHFGRRINVHSLKKKPLWYEAYTTPLALMHALIARNNVRYKTIIETIDEDIRLKRNRTMGYYFKLLRNKAL